MSPGVTAAYGVSLKGSFRTDKRRLRDPCIEADRKYSTVVILPYPRTSRRITIAVVADMDIPTTLLVFRESNGKHTEWQRGSRSSWEQAYPRCC